MSLFLEDGSRVTAATVTTTPDPDPLVSLDTDLYTRRSIGRNDSEASGTIHTLFARAGTQLRQSGVAALFQSAVVARVVPSKGAAAGGDVVTIQGERLDSVTGVNFDGVAGTNLTLVGPGELTVTTPAGTGPATLTLADDAGNTTVEGLFTYE